MESFRYFRVNTTHYNTGLKLFCKLSTQDLETYPFKIRVSREDGRVMGDVNMDAAQVEENIKTEYWREIPAAEWVLLLNFL